MKAMENRERGSAGQHQGAAMKKGWQIKKLGDVCSLLNRGVSPAYLEKGGVCVLNQKCIRDHEVSYEPSRRHDSKAKKVAEERFIQLGDVLVNSTGTGTLGRVAQVRDEPEEATTVDSHVTIVRPKPGLFHLDFFGYMLVVIEDAIKEAGEGCGGQTELARSVLAERFSVSYPESLAEQQRIVGLLDEAFEGLATAKANAEKNLQNARALFESHLKSVFTQRGPGWVETKLDDVTDLITCGVAKRPDYVPEGIPFLSAKNVKSGQVIWSGHQYVSEESHRALTKHNKPKIGDILYTRVGSYGEAAIIDRDVEFSIFVSLTLIKPKPVVLNSFLKHYLNSSAVKELAADSITGSGVGNLNVGTVREFPIHLPPLAEQRSIVSQLDDLREETQRLARLYERKHAVLEALKKSLLHQAFTGLL